MLIGNIVTSPARTNRKGQTIRALLGLSSTVADIPHAQVVEQPPGVVQEPHFHEIDQYQLITAGSGRIGAKPVTSGQYQYTDRATTYGPIVGAADGINYLVLRPRGEPGVDISARFMPQSRHLRSRRPGRHRYGDTAAVSEDPGNWWRLSSDAGDGGLVATAIAPEGLPVTEPSRRSECGPGYLVVLRGSLVVNGERLGSPSVVWVEVDDPWPRIEGGPSGGTAVWFSFSRSHT
jgi:hypothetical protein